MPNRSNGFLRVESRSDRAQNGYVLIVDDEPYIRLLISRIVRGQGYPILMAADGVGALAQIARWPIRLIICNLRMPRMSGPELYDLLWKISPAMAGRLVFCSGDTVSEQSGQFLESSGRPWLAKPFDLDDLVRMVEGQIKSPARLDARAALQVSLALARYREEQARGKLRSQA